MADSHQPKSAFTFLPHGAAIQEFNVGGHNIVLNFPEANLYKIVDHPYFGETIGRTTNRIKDAKVSLNGKTYTLAANNGGNTLHGGKEGWGKKNWNGPKPVNRNGKEGVQFTYLSKDMDEGYPGTVEARVWYTAGMENGKTVLEVEYEVEHVGDESEGDTVVGVTNHSYFNLNLPAATITGTVCTLGTNFYQEITADGIPTGRIIPHSSIPSTLYKPFTFSDIHPDPDDCFVMNPDPSSIPIDTRPLPLKTLATLHHPNTGLHLEIESTEPAFQFYSGRFIDVPGAETSAGEKVPARGPRSGICVEPSRYVDAPGREEWKGMCLVKRGQVWGAKNLYRAWKD